VVWQGSLGITRRPYADLWLGWKDNDREVGPAGKAHSEAVPSNPSTPANLFELRLP